MNCSPDIIVRPMPGVPGFQNIYFRVTPESAQLLEDCLRGQGLAADTVVEHSLNPDLLSIMLEFSGAIPIAAILVAIRNFYHRNDGKSIKFADLEVTGFSEAQFRRILEDVEQKRVEIDTSWRESTPQAEDRDESDHGC